jgi:hypothetical protein
MRLTVKAHLAIYAIDVITYPAFSICLPITAMHKDVVSTKSTQKHLIHEFFYILTLSL